LAHTFSLFSHHSEDGGDQQGHVVLPPYTSTLCFIFSLSLLVVSAGASLVRHHYRLFRVLRNLRVLLSLGVGANALAFR
jgi:hypothetical protein